MSLFQSGLAAFLLLAVLLCVVIRPWGLPVVWPAAIGALLALVTGLVPFNGLVTIFLDTWDASLTLIALCLLSEALNSNGFFSWAALYVARLAQGSGLKLYILFVFLTVVTTALLANDGAVLILTPIVATLLVKIYRKETTWLPFIFAVGFLADATSTLLIPSNLTNIILANAVDLRFLHFAIWMILPTFLAALIAGLCFAFRFRSSLRERYNVQALEQPASAVLDRVTFWVSRIALFLLVGGYIVGGQLNVPVALIAVPIALIMVLVVQYRSVSTVGAIFKAAPWDIVFYALGMFVVITVAYYAHVLTFVTNALFYFLQPASGFWGVVSAGGILALLSAGANNLPATLIGVLVLKAMTSFNHLGLYALVIGVDIGPKLTPYGSLATLLWLGILRQRGIHISWGGYLKEMWWVTLLTLGAAFGGLFLVGLLLSR